MKKHIINFARFAITAAFMVAVVGVAHAWTGPTATPTGGNVDAPVNTGTVSQYKKGLLGVEGFVDIGTALHYGNISEFDSILCPIFCGTGPLTGDLLDIMSSALGGGTLHGLRVDKNGAVITNSGLNATASGNFSGNIFSAFYQNPGGANPLGVGFVVGSDGSATQSNGLTLFNSSGASKDIFDIFNNAGESGNPSFAITALGDAIFRKGIKITTGAAVNDVLTSDADGNATWQPIQQNPQVIPSIILWITNFGGGKDNNGYVTATCPQNYPVLISGGVECPGGKRMVQNYADYIGDNNGDVGSYSGHCVDGAGTGFDPSDIRLICSNLKAQSQYVWNIDNGGSAYTAAWHPIYPSSTQGPDNTSCAAWLAPYIAGLNPPNPPIFGGNVQANQPPTPSPVNSIAALFHRTGSPYEREVITFPGGNPPTATGTCVYRYTAAGGISATVLNNAASAAGLTVDKFIVATDNYALIEDPNFAQPGWSPVVSMPEAQIGQSGYYGGAYEEGLPGTNALDQNRGIWSMNTLLFY